MRRFALPLLVCAAVGALIVILVKRGEEPETPARPREAGTVSPFPEEAPRSRLPFGPAKTRTSLDEHEALRELERSLQRDDLSHVGSSRQRVCEDIDTIERSEKLSNNLLALIREYGVNSDDERRRMWVLPILRVFKHPEATKLIEQEYYAARNDDERDLLLEAMSHAYHNPQLASVWAVERALNATGEEHRHHAFQVIQDNSGNDELTVDTAIQIYSATTRPKQRDQMMESIAFHSTQVKKAEEFLRSRLKRPRAGELLHVISRIEGWGTEADAAQLDVLADEFPALGEQLRERARAVRRMLKTRSEEELERERAEDERRAAGE